MDKNRTVKDRKGNTVSLCSFRWVDPDGKIEVCFSHAACPVCGQCSRLDGERERGHCPGHTGLMWWIAVPGNEAFNKLQKMKQEAQRKRA